MRRALLFAIAGMLTIATTAFAGDYPPQGLPKAPLRADETKQGGRLKESSVSYRVESDLCVTQSVLGDGTFPRPRPVTPEVAHALRFRLEAERRPDVSLRYWTEVDQDGFPVGEPTPVPIDVVKKKDNGDFILRATLDVPGDRYLALSAFWEGKGICGGSEFLFNHYALAAK
ncbi:MAG TPA: hypothetical protein VD766_00455 [Solirubrobacterales bacterium]|nr:hypothetical protein [Solirubrobacterales bacterium]